MAEFQAYNKSAVAHAFGRAAKTYDQHAAFQRDVGAKLMQGLPQDLTGWRVLDLGCGTGYFTYLLAERGAQVVALDLSPDMLKVCRSRCSQYEVEYLVADAEHLPFESSCFDLVFSNLALQWCHDLAPIVHDAVQYLNPNGRFLFSTLLQGSLHELDSAWKVVDSNHRHINNFHSESGIHSAISNLSKVSKAISKASLNVYAHRCWYPSALALMKDLKGIGATHGAGRARGLTKPSVIQQLEMAYQPFSDLNGLLPATYQVALGEVYL
ncbi:malonyl-ACP O-methyltransferase BioC [Vibrio gangliei]|uniref:malonyl-ACP O-methyltransferase BioC n=1 Tax=Vibrio gangliei TaxID=2077090 RepID=UPI000D011D4B|nr:malonyl-ACP O-methyltransferase BioC [Vibrio gangliei]